MVTLRTEVEAPAIAIEQYIGAVPVLMDHFAQLPFDDDGVAHFDVGRRSGLRLLSGTHGYEGSRYRIVAEASADASVGAAYVGPVEVELTTCRAELAEFTIHSVQVAGTVALDDPAVPSRVRCALDLALPDLPAYVGSSLHVAGTARLQHLWELPGPQLAGHFGVKSVTGDVTAEIGRPAPGRWRVALTITLRPRGVFVVALVAWPLLRRRAERAVADAVRDVLIDLADEGDDSPDRPRGPVEIGDWIFAQVPDALVR